MDERNQNDQNDTTTVIGLNNLVAHQKMLYNKLNITYNKQVK